MRHSEGDCLRVALFRDRPHVRSAGGLLFPLRQPRKRSIMKRSILFDRCEERLTTLCTRVELRGRLNVLNLNIHCEYFFVRLLNKLLSYQLTNINATIPNAEGVDLVDHTNRIILQVSSTATKQKIESALTKDLSGYHGYSFRFVPVVVNASNLAKLSFKNPHCLAFNPPSDILDIKSLLNVIMQMSLTDQRAVLDILNEELIDTPVGAPTHLAAVIRILAAENLNELEYNPDLRLFNVDTKLISNQLSAAKEIIEDYKVHHSRVDRVYAEFDMAGRNRSKSVLDSFRNIYLRLNHQFTGDELFFRIVDSMMEAVLASANHVEIPKDELLLCVNVLAIDAFIRCKILKAPPESDHVAA